MTWLLLATALAQEPRCPDRDFEAVPEAMSVAWVSPVRRRVRAGTMLEVVRTSELRDWLRDHPEAGLGRTLQVLGMKRKARPPRRRFKVTIFEARADDLCRPFVDQDVTELAGVRACDGHTRRHARCGYTVDRADDGRGLDVFRVAWRDVAIRGFCVLPAERFLAEGREP